MRHTAGTGTTDIPSDSLTTAESSGVDLGGVGAHQGMTPPRAGEQLVAVVRAVSSGASTHNRLGPSLTEEQAMSTDIDAHVGRIEETGYTIVEDAIDLDV